ncbi:hypothetical protein [Candidatus Nitrosocosmicus franklandus]|uniref:Uncharacterized protein n=1 Tax=Candidatus Nitrosocosmicus franklandianus TaxID=1798806 RepID=A0A484I880_9ARCH|nr:hypothetical protein [Candidatus Nitrosocosmicus franklandus]VFJ13306.1 protein of unknown function [Candidatus Nitrosocosmicus franklandus]
MIVQYGLRPDTVNINKNKHEPNAKKINDTSNPATINEERNSNIIRKTHA